MRTTLTKETITALVYALHHANSTKDNEAGSYFWTAERCFDELPKHLREEYVDHLLGIAQYATQLARTLIDREMS